MQVTVNDKVFNFPTSLPQIPLGWRIEFDDMYGKELNNRLKEIAEMPDGPEKDLEDTIWQADSACKFFAFFTELDLETVQDAVDLATVMQVYSTCNHLLADDLPTELQQVFDWRGEKWVLQAPELKPESEMTFGELIDAKQLLQDIIAVGRGEFDKLLAVCSVYLRPTSEAYDKTKQAERAELFKELPMDIALHVAFFLASSISSYRTFLASSSLQVSKAAGMQQSTLKSGDG